jgi:hypothetical protein
MNAFLIVAAAVAGVAFVICRQLKGEPLRGRRVLLLPVILIAAGAVSLAGARHLGAADIACVAIGAILAAAIGLGQGTLMRLELRDGGLWGQLPTRGLWLWGALIVSRLALVAIAVPLGAHAVSSGDSILFVLGVNRLAQAAVIAWRAVAAGIPFAAEKDGKTFLPGVFGSAGSSKAPVRPSTQGMQSSPVTSTRYRGTAARGAITPQLANWSDVGRVVADRCAARP